ncbi:MAG: hypothetical protein E3K37_02425 [Candidatus Kuenenia sp.]|nr:hypothetical protein [Candidatus Kuenenia hertensis]
MRKNIFYGHFINSKKSYQSFRKKILQSLLFIFLATAFAAWLLFSKNKNIRLDLSPLLYLLPMYGVSGYISILFLRKFEELHYQKHHKDRRTLAAFIDACDFLNAQTLIRRSNDKLIQKYANALVGAIDKVRRGIKPAKISRREISLDLPVWQSCKAIPTIVGFAFSIIGVVTTMLTLGNANGAQHPSVQDILSGVGVSLMSSIAGTYFSFLIIIYFLILTIMKHRMAETEKNFFHEIGMEADNA